MKITPILTQLRAQCPTLANRVAAGIDLATLQASNPLATPCAYVVPITDVASKSVAQNLMLQPIRDRFEVTLVLDTMDAAAALDQLHDLRAELWRALVGFKPGSDYSDTAYDGGDLLPLEGREVPDNAWWASTSGRWRYHYQSRERGETTGNVPNKYHWREPWRVCVRCRVEWLVVGKLIY